MKKEVGEEFNLIRGIIFFMDVFLALLIIITASTLIKTSFGVMTIIFGFFMLLLTAISRFMGKW